MDFEIVKRQIATAYSQGEFEWSLTDHCRVFRYFFDAYKSCRGREHPHLRTATIKEVMERLEDYSIGETLNLIDQYFESSLECDYSLVHFTSGRVREMRAYEIMLADC